MSALPSLRSFMGGSVVLPPAATIAGPLSFAQYDNFPPGDVFWTNVSNAGSADGQYANITNLDPADPHSWWLLGRELIGASVPDSDTVFKIVVGLDRRIDPAFPSTAPGPQYADLSMQLYDSGFFGDDLPDSEIWGAVQKVVLYEFGVNLTGAQVKSFDFGVGFRLQSLGGTSGQGQVDHLFIAEVHHAPQLNLFEVVAGYRVQLVKPTASGGSTRLPDPSHPWFDDKRGGPVFFVLNQGSVSTTLRDQHGTPMSFIGSGNVAEMHLFGDQWVRK